MATVAGPASLTYQPHVLASILRSLCVTTCCPLGEAWAPVPGDQLQFELVSSFAHGPGQIRVHVRTEGGASFTQPLDSAFIRANKESHSLALRLCEDTVERGTVVYSYSELDTDALLRALEFRFQTALAVPVTLDGAVVAVLVLFASQPLNVSEHVIGFVHSTACSLGSLMGWHKSLVTAQAAGGTQRVPPAVEFTNVLPQFPSAKPPAVTPTMLCADSVLLTMGMALGACRCESWFPFMEATGKACFRITALVLPSSEAGSAKSADGDPASNHLCASIQSRPSQMWWDQGALASLGSPAKSATSFPVLQKGPDDTDTLAAVIIIFWNEPFAQHMSVTNFLLHAAHAVGLATPLAAGLPQAPSSQPLPAARAAAGAAGWSAGVAPGHTSSGPMPTMAGSGVPSSRPPPARVAAPPRKRGRDEEAPAAGLSAAAGRRREEYDRMGGTRELSAVEMELVRRDVRDTKTVQSVESRRGKWTPEEEAYCAELVAGFQSGILPIAEGTTLRSMLSQQLHCVAMRITKKYNKSSSMGKQMYKRSAAMDPITWCTARDACLTKLATLRDRFVQKVMEKSGLQLDEIVQDAIGSKSFFDKGITVQAMAQLVASAGLPMPALPADAEGDQDLTGAASATALHIKIYSLYNTAAVVGDPGPQGEAQSTLRFIDEDKFRVKVWEYLFGNLRRSVEELYAMCEYETSSMRCAAAIDELRKALAEFSQLEQRFAAIRDFEHKAITAGRLPTDHSRPRTSLGVAWDVSMPGAPARRAGLSRLQFIDVLERLKESGELGAIQAQYRAAHTDQAPPAQAQASGDSSAKRCAAQSYAAAVSQTSSPTAGHKARSGDTFGAKLTSGALLVQSDPEPVPRKRKAGRQRRGGGSRSAPPPDVEAVLRAPQDRFPEFMKDFEESTRPSPSRPEAREVVAHEGGQGSGQGGEGPRTPPRVARSADLPPLTTPSSPTGGAASPRSASTEGHTRRALLDKLNSPERLRASAEETAKRNAARHAKAEANRAKLEVLRQAKLREKANKVRAVSERAAKLKPGSTPPQSLETRLAAAVSRKQAHIDSVRQKATSENQKVGEVGFINTMNRAGRQADMQQRHARVAVRRETHLASVAAKAGTSAARAGRVAADRHALEAQEAAAKAASLEKRLVEGAARRAAALSDRVAKAASDSPRSTPPPGKSRWGVDGQGQVTSYETSPPRAGEAGKATSYAAAVGLGQAGRKGSTRAPAAPARVAPLSAPSAETAPPLPDPAPVQRQKRSVRRSPSTKRAPKHSKGTSWDGLSSDVTSLVLTGEFASPVPRSGGADDAAFAVTPTPAPAPSPPRRQARKSLTSATTHPRDGDAAAEDAGKEELEALLRGRAADSEASGPSPLRLFRLSRLGLRPDAAPEAVAVALEAAKRAKTRARKVRKALHKAAKPVPEDGTGRLGRVPPNLGPRLTRALGAVLRAVHTDGSSKLQHPTLLPLACPLPGTLSTALSSLLTVLDSSGAYCEAQATLPEGVLSATFRLQRLFDQGQEEADEGGSEFRAVPGTGAAKDITSEAASTAVSLRMTGVQAAALAEGGFLRIAASTCTPHHFEQQPSLLVLALRVLLLACALPDNCTHMLEHGLVVPIVDTLATALDALPLADMGALAHFQPAAVCSEHLAALGHAEPARWSTEEMVPPAPLDEVARKSQPVAVVMASLQFLWLLYRKAGPQLSLLSKYMVHAGVLQRLTTLTGLLRDSPTLVAFSPLLRTVMAFHVSVLNSHPAQRVPVLHGPSSVAAGDVVTSCVLSTHLLGAPSLLLGILMAVAPRARTRTHTRPRTASGSPGAGASDATTGDAVTALPPSALATCVLALKVTNAALRLDLKAVSTALGEATTQTSIFHALEHLLAHIGQHLAVAPTPGSGIDVTEELLWEVLLLTGYLLRGGGGHAEMLRWGPPPTPLQRLVTLPFRYFTQHPYTAVLLPTLLAACAADAGNAEVVLKHVSKDMLLSFLGAVAAGGATGQPSGTVVVHESGVRLAPFGGMPAVILPPALAGLVPRLPKAFMPQHRLDLSEAGMSAMRGALAAAEGATSPLPQSLEGQVTPPSKTAPDFDAMD